jgi:hypothetical protein
MRAGKATEPLETVPIGTIYRLIPCLRDKFLHDSPRGVRYTTASSPQDIGGGVGTSRPPIEAGRALSRETTHASGGG